MTGPLDGVRIVELGTMIAVPYATYILATQGAAVIKVEGVGSGDELRYYGSIKNGMSAWFVNSNGGKRSLGVDLRQEAGKRILWQLLERADVLVQGFRPGVMKRLGFDYDAVAERFPNLLYCSSSGFGADGPDAALPVYDPVIQARSGWAGAQQTGNGPMLIRGMVADKVAALTTAQLITAGLVQRGRTGRGSHIQVNMLEANINFNWTDVMMHCSLLDDDADHRPNLLLTYRLLRCADGWLSVAAGTDAQWRGFCEAFGRTDLAGHERLVNAAARAANVDFWYDRMEEMVRTEPRESALARLRAADVPAAPVLNPDQVADDPQVRALGLLQDVEHPAAGRHRRPRPSASVFGADVEIGPAPRLGEHTGKILAELGYDPKSVSSLVKDKAVHASAEAG